METVAPKTEFETLGIRSHFLKVGFHYTSKKNWRRIQREGMVPYLINKPELDKYFPDGVRGIWCWEYDLTGKSEMGSILYQLSTKQTHEIVKLKILYTEDEVLKHKGMNIKLFHSGNINDYIYHTDEQAIILTQPIEPSRVQLVKEIDAIKRLTE